MTDITSAQTTYDEAALALYRAQALEDLRHRPGLAYAAVVPGNHIPGPFVVALNGKLIGEVNRRGAGALRCWYAHAYSAVLPEEIPEDAARDGQDPTIRAAAASLLTRYGTPIRVVK